MAIIAPSRSFGMSARKRDALRQGVDSRNPPGSLKLTFAPSNSTPRLIADYLNRTQKPLIKTMASKRDKQ